MKEGEEEHQGCIPSQGVEVVEGEGQPSCSHLEQVEGEEVGRWVVTSAQWMDRGEEEGAGQLQVGSPGQTKAPWAWVGCASHPGQEKGRDWGWLWGPIQSAVAAVQTVAALEEGAGLDHAQ